MRYTREVWERLHDHFDEEGDFDIGDFKISLGCGRMATEDECKRLLYHYNQLFPQNLFMGKDRYYTTISFKKECRHENPESRCILLIERYIVAGLTIDSTILSISANVDKKFADDQICDYALKNEELDLYFSPLDVHLRRKP